jgi:DnaK suppressor protein
MERIDRAIQSIEEDHFGICESCSQALEPAQLEALPYATHCSRCRS